MTMDPPRLRLLALAEERGVSLASLSRLLGKNGSYLQQFLRKGSPRKLEETDRAALAEFFGVAATELGAPQENSFAVGRAMPSEWVDIPRLNLRASAGPGLVAEGEAAVGSFRFTRRWLRDQDLQPAHLSAITVSGDSMEPVLRDGDEILVDTRRLPLRDGIHVVDLDGALLVKRLETRRAGHLTLLSDNTGYPPIERPAGEIKVIGRVVWKAGRL